MSERADEQQDAKGPEGTIPGSEDGVGAGVTDEPSNFEPEEDEDTGDQQDG